MNIYCIKCKNKTNTLNIERIQNTKNRNIIKGNCEICNSKKSTWCPTVSQESQFEKLREQSCKNSTRY